MDGNNPRKPGSTPNPPKRAEYWGRTGPLADELTSVRLIRKLADVIDGIDLTHASVGDWIELSRREANILIAEGWAEPADDNRSGQVQRHREIAADRSQRLRPKPED